MRLFPKHEIHLDSYSRIYDFRCLIEGVRLTFNTFCAFVCKDIHNKIQVTRLTGHRAILFERQLVHALFDSSFVFETFIQCYKLGPEEVSTRSTLHAALLHLSTPDVGATEQPPKRVGAAFEIRKWPPKLITLFQISMQSSMPKHYLRCSPICLHHLSLPLAMTTFV